METTKTWLAAHLYYATPWESFLTDAVAPLVNMVLKEKIVEQFFFIRYNEKGPHIRLRFKGDTMKINNELKPFIAHHFNQYFQAYPSILSIPDDEIPKGWFPNNSLQFIPYEPEVDRYGGRNGLKVAERQFHLSSQVTLDMLANSKGWSYQTALSSAIQMHLALIYALGMDLDESKAFFSFFSQQWMFSTYHLLSETKLKVGSRKKGDQIGEWFELSYKEQRNSIVPFVQHMWEALMNCEGATEINWLERWINGMKVIGMDLERLHKANKLTFPYDARQFNCKDISLEKKERWTIYFSYVHMINNRLGLLNQDEAFIGYLLASALDEVNALYDETYGA